MKRFFLALIHAEAEIPKEVFYFQEKNGYSYIKSRVTPNSDYKLRYDELDKV